MPEGVVDFLETVEVEHDEPELLAPARARRDPAVQGRAIGKPGETVVGRLVTERVLGVAAVGHVAEVAHDAADVGVIEQVGGDRLHPQPPAVGVAEPVGRGAQGPARLGLEPEDVTRDGLEVVGVDERRHRLEQADVAAVAHHALDRRRRERDAPFRVEDDHDVGGVEDERPPSTLLGRQRLGARDPRAHVAEGDDRAPQRPVGEDRVGAVLDGDERAVGPRPPVDVPRVRSPAADGAAELAVLARERRAIGSAVVHDLVGVAPVRRAAVEAQERLGGSVHENDDAVGVGSDDAVAAVVEEQPRPLLRRGQPVAISGQVGRQGGDPPVEHDLPQQERRGRDGGSDDQSVVEPAEHVL